MKLIRGEDGEICTAKLAYVLTLAVILFKVVIGGVSFGGVDIDNADVSELSVLLGVVGATYYGRARTKKGGRHVD